MFLFPDTVQVAFAVGLVLFITEELGATVCSGAKTVGHC